MDEIEILRMQQGMKHRSVKNISIAYKDVGKGSIPIIFIHGFPFDSSTWDEQLQFLEATHRAIAYDIRGYGNSTTDHAEVSIDLYADDLITFMDALAIDKAVVCGLSMGGYILLNALKRYPSRFTAIVLSDTQCIADEEETKQHRAATIVKIKADGLTEFANNFIKTAFHPQTLISNPALVEKTKAIILNQNIKTVCDGLNAIAQRNETCSMLEDIKIPTLVICGNHDKVTLPIQSRYLKNTIKHSTLHFIEDASHLSNLEHPTVFNNLILRFLKSTILA